MMQEPSARLTQLSEQKQELWRQLRQEAPPAKALAPLGPRPAGLSELPLSYTQRSLWFLAQLLPESPFYNMPSALRLQGQLHEAALRQVFDEIVARHEALRTVFPAHEGRPLQRILPPHPASFRVESLEHLPPEERERAAHLQASQASLQPFSLAEGPLLRVVLYRLGPQDHLLLLLMHHIVSDGWSLGLLTNEITQLYTAFCQGQPSPLPPLALQYADYALWQQEWFAGNHLEPQLDYWRKQLQGVQPLQIATDFPRPPQLTFRGQTIYVDFPPALTRTLEALGQQEGVTLFMVLMAGFQSLLFRYGGGESIAVGTPIANRSRREIEGLIGFFANSLVLHTDFRGRPDFREVLRRVKEVTLGAYANQDVPFEMLVDRLQIERHAALNPLFQVMLALQSAPAGQWNLPGLWLWPQDLESQTTHFDLELHLWHKPEKLGGFLCFNRDLFEESTVRRFIVHLQEFLQAAAGSPTQPIETLNYLTPAELQICQARAQVPLVNLPARILPDLLREQAQGHPSLPALIKPLDEFHASLNYGELAHHSAQWAARWQAWGLKPGMRIGWGLAPTRASLAALWGLWRAGGVAVLCGADWPLPTLQEALAGTQAEGILSEKSILEALPQTLRLQRWNWEELNGSLPEGTWKAPELSPESPACLLWEGHQALSLSHQHLLQQAERLQQVAPLRPGEAIPALLAPASLGWVLELLWVTQAGAAWVLAQPENDWKELFQHYLFPYWQVTPGDLGLLAKALEQAPPGRLAGMRAVMVSGGLLPKAGFQAFHKKVPVPVLWLYLPPESGALLGWSHEAEGPGEFFAVKHFTPAPVLILDAQKQWVAQGVWGQVWVAAPAGNPGEAEGPAEPALAPLVFRRSATWGRWHSAEVLELQPAPGRIWQAGQSYPASRLAAILREHPALAEVAVRSRLAGQKLETLVYFAPALPIPCQALKDYLATRWPQAWSPAAFVKLSRLPRTPEGLLEESALLKFPVLEPELLPTVQASWQALPAIDQARAVIQEVAPLAPRWHLRELLPQASRLGSEQHATTSFAETLRPEDWQNFPPAFADGGPLVIPPEAPRTLQEALLRLAETCPQEGILFVPSETSQVFLSYAELIQEARRALSGLRAAGLQRGQRVILQSLSVQDHLCTFWGCVLGGIIPVTVATATSYQQKNSILAKLWNTWQLLKQPVILASRELLEPLRGVPALYGESQPFQVLAMEELRAHPPSEFIEPSHPEEVVFLQLTSGSTGLPKCIQETHRAIISHIHASQQYNDYRPGEVSLNWLPMDHVVPILLMHLRDTYLGYRQVQISTNVVLANPLKWLDLVDSQRVTLSWSPNFGFKLVVDRLTAPGERTWDLSCWRYVMNAGEQVTLPVVEEFLKALAPFGLRPEVMQPAYGMAELATVITHENNFSPARSCLKIAKASLNARLRPSDSEAESIAFIRVGPAAPGVQMRITDAENRLLPEGVIGRLQVRGPTVMPGYLYNDEANQEAFVGEGWFNTGDLGFLLEGNLTITGREKEIIIVRGANFYCYEIEDVVNRVEGVEPTFSAAVAIDDPNTGTEGLAIFFVPRVREPLIEPMLLQRIKEQVGRQVGISPACVIPLALEEFPKTTSGKIQRTQLKKALAAGQFEELLRKIDLLAQNTKTLPAWFFRPTWEARPLSASLPVLGPEVTLIISEGGELSQVWSQTEAGRAAIWVKPSRQFQSLHRHQYTLDLNQHAHYRQLWQALEQAGTPIQQIFYLPTSTPPALESLPDLEQAERLGVQSLLALVQSWNTHAPGSPLRLWVVTCGQEVLLPGEVPQVAFAAVGGLLASVEREFPRLEVHQVELPPRLAPAEALALIWAEAQNPGFDLRSAWRQGRRWVPVLEPVRFPQPASALPFHQEGAYVLTGGLGGIGPMLAQYLVEHYQARVLIVGRTSPEALDEERRQALTSLSVLGNVRYAAVDLADLPAMQACLQDHAELWGIAWSGAVHLAGHFATRLLSEETPESLSESLRAKVQGSWVLTRLLPPQALLIGFGSVNGFLGGSTAGAYSAANSFLAGLLAWRKAQGSPTFSLSWSLWDEVGMSRGYWLKEQSREQGYEAIERGQGLLSFLAALHGETGEYLIGLEASKPNVRRWLQAPAQASERLQVYYQLKPGASQGWSVPSLAWKDRLGQPLSAEAVRLEELPLNERGELELKRLSHTRPAQSGPVAPKIAPRTSLERTIAGIWQQVLKLESVGIHQNFFELGGQSLLLVQVHSQLQQALQRSLSIVDLLRYPTIHTLAGFLGEAVPESRAKNTYEEAQERARQQKAMRQRRVPPRGRV